MPEEEFSFITRPKIHLLDVNSFDDLHISEASVQSMLPKGFDAEINKDVLPVAFNLAKINEINENGDAMNSLAAIKSVKHFANKPINVEHKRHKIVGHIINASLSEKEFDFSENDLSKFADKEEPFYLNAVGFIYSKIFPELAEAIIEAADEDNPEYQSISTSWELAFKKFKIVKSNSTSLADGEYIDEGSYEEYRKYIKRFGGDGVDKEGNLVARVVYTDATPLGAGLTVNPAADVQGVYPIELTSQQQTEQKAVAEKQKNSQIIKQDVRKNKPNIFNMDEKQTKEFLEGVQEAVASVIRKESEAKSIGQVFQDAISEHSESWKSKVKTEAEARATAEKQLQILTESNDKLTKEFDQLKSDMEAKASSELFNSRMNFFDDKYELTEQENEIIASELKSVEDSEDAFASFKDRVEVMFAHKSKETIAKLQKEEDDRIEQAVAKKLAEQNGSTESQESNASTDSQQEGETETEDLETEETEAAKIPNNGGETSQQKTLLEKVKESFKVEIS